MFGKKSNNKKTKKEEIEINPRIAEQTHVMPQRFYFAPKKKKGSPVVVVIVGIVLIAVLSAAGYFFLRNSNQAGVIQVDSDQPSANRNTNQLINQNTNQSVNQNINQLSGNRNENADQNNGNSISTTTNSNVNADANANVNAGTNVNTATGDLSPAVDFDSDSLTALEEALFGTDPNVSDSDGDGYSDGNEIINGYDPTRPRVSLSDSGLIRTYSNAEYSVIYPSNWQVRDLGGDEIIFQATNGEFVEIFSIPNQDNIGLSDWFKQQFPEISFGSVTQVKINNLDGIRSVDRLTYYLVDSNDSSLVYLITYNIGNSTEINFNTTFNVMVKNFRLSK